MDILSGTHIQDIALNNWPARWCCTTSVIWQYNQWFLVAYFYFLRNITKTYNYTIQQIVKILNNQLGYQHFYGDDIALSMANGRTSIWVYMFAYGCIFSDVTFRNEMLCGGHSRIITLWLWCITHIPGPWLCPRWSHPVWTFAVSRNIMFLVWI